jgi:hypothetical protein
MQQDINKDIVELFNSLPFLKFESEGSFGRHYRFSTAPYKVILYTDPKYVDTQSQWRTSYHKEVEWDKKNKKGQSNMVTAWFNSSFEEIFESVDDDLREQLSWYLDIFT